MDHVITQVKSEASSEETSLSMQSTFADTNMSLESQPRSSPASSTHSKYILSPRIVSDAILGLSDGLTVPFALTAGLSALGTTRIVVLGGLAELLAGAISMGLGGFVGAKSEAESYHATERTCERLIKYSPNETRHIVQEHFSSSYHLADSNITTITENLANSPVALHSFLMTHHFGLTSPPDSRPYISALTLGVSYILGGIIPLIPYFVVKEVLVGLYWSIGLMGVVLLVFGYVKTGVVRGWKGTENVLAGVRGAVQMLIVGAAAAGAAIGLVRAFSSAGNLR